MVHQAPLNRNGVDRSPVRDMARTAAGLWHHVLTLMELQSRLLLIELGEGLCRMRTAAIVVAAGVILALGAVPIFLVCLALILVEAAHLSPAASFAMISTGTMLISSWMVVAGARRLRGAVSVPRSRLEWRLNWSWLKATLEEESASRRHSSSSARS
jgi:Putative Actinobacterial Holin-X, holin superfamily III